jgi:hypothetical protein
MFAGMNRPEAVSPPSGWKVPATIALVAWLVIELVFLGQAMHLTSYDMLGAIKLAFPRSLVWLIFAPLATWLAFRFPLEPGRASRNVLIHVASCVILVIASHRVLYYMASVVSHNQAERQPHLRVRQYEFLPEPRRATVITARRLLTYQYAALMKREHRENFTGG